MKSTYKKSVKSFHLWKSVIQTIAANLSRLTLI